MSKQLRLLLADDDEDDQFFFKTVLERLSIPTTHSTVDTGEKLMQALTQNRSPLPDVLFLDLNMPGKTGLDCLQEIKKSKKFNKIPVIIYSMYPSKQVANLLYECGAHYFIQKTDVIELQRSLQYVLNDLLENNGDRPPREEFLLKIHKHIKS